MNPLKLIENFLDQVRKTRSRMLAFNGLYLLLILLGVCLLVGNAVSYFTGIARDYIIPYVLACLAPFFYILVRYFIRGAFAKFNRDNAAILTEKKHPELKNGLINSWQLGHHLKNPEADRYVSISFVRNLLQQTSERIQGIRAESIINDESVVKSRNWFLGVLLLLGVISFVLPDFWRVGYHNLITPPLNIEQAALVADEPKASISSPAETSYMIEDIRLTLNYPAYTKQKSEVIHPSDGKVQVLPGTEVRITARTNQPIQEGYLVINGKDRFPMSAQETQLNGTFMVREKGFYQFQVKTPAGQKVLIPKKYSINLIKDGSPKIVLFLANPKPVYFLTDKVQFYYEGHDDFGIQSIVLVMEINQKKHRKLLKNLKGQEADIQDGYAWNLNQTTLNPGDEVNYFLEILDNDNVLGPNRGQSEIYSFTLFDSRKEMEDLIALQDQMVEKMITLLAQSLVVNIRNLKRSPQDMLRLKKTMSSNADQLIDIINLAHRINNQAQTLQSFPRSYLTLLDNIITGLTEVREEYIDSIRSVNNLLKKSIPVGYNFPPIEPLHDKLVSHLEKDILFLVKISNRQKMDQVMDLEKQLANLTESLREEFEQIKNKKASLRKEALRKKIKKIQQTLQKMMEKLSQQTQGLPDEFLNSSAFKKLDLDSVNTSFEKLMKLMNEGDIEAALKELEEIANNLRLLANQLDQANDQLDDVVDMKLMEKIEDSIQDLLKLEKEQKGLLEQSTKINQSLREAQSKKFEQKLNDIFAALKKDVNEIQNILLGSEEFLDQHPKMIQHNRFMEDELELNQEIEKLRQEALKDHQKSELSNNFKKLNEARKKLANLVSEMRSLQVKTFNEYKNFIPEFKERYDSLEELTELRDLNEFNSLFKKTYPHAFRWQHTLRRNPFSRSDLSNRLNADLRQVVALNSEISKKLGTLMRELRQEYKSLVSEKNKGAMGQMAKEQNQMRKESQDMARQFFQMNKENPIISSDLSRKMTGAGKYMKMAEGDLIKHDVPQTIDSQNHALRELAETREMLNEIKNANNAKSKKSGQMSPIKLGSGRSRDPRQGGSIRMQREKVDLPSEDQYQVPGQFRSEILEAMKHKYPRKYERFVMEYYKELVK